MTDDTPRFGDHGLTRRKVLRTTGASAIIGGTAAGAFATTASARRVQHNPEPTLTFECDDSNPLESCVTVSGRLTGLGNTDIIGWLFANVEVEQQCVTRGNAQHPPGQPDSETATAADVGVITPENGNAPFTFEICVPDTVDDPLDCTGGHNLEQTAMFDNPTLCFDLNIDNDDLDANGDPVIENLECDGRLRRRFADQICSNI